MEYLAAIGFGLVGACIVVAVVILYAFGKWVADGSH